MNRRLFLKQCSAAGALATTFNQIRQPHDVLAAVNRSDEASLNGAVLPDDGWNLWIDEQAHWETDEIYLPDSFDLEKLPQNPPTGGWNALDTNRGTADAAIVTLPCTVEQIFWKRFGSRPYTPDEYRYAADDPDSREWRLSGSVLVVARHSDSRFADRSAHSAAYSRGAFAR